MDPYTGTHVHSYQATAASASTGALPAHALLSCVICGAVWPSIGAEAELLALYARGPALVADVWEKAMRHRKGVRGQASEGERRC